MVWAILILQHKPHNVRGASTPEATARHLVKPETYRYPLQPERSGSIDSALLGLRYLISLSSIAAKHTQEDAQRYEGGLKHQEQHELELARQSQYGCNPAPVTSAVNFCKEIAVPASTLLLPPLMLHMSASCSVYVYA